jgi:hypothetical protein
MKKILLGSLIATSLLMADNSVDVNVNADTVEVSADVYLNDMYDVNNDSNYYLTLRHLRTEKDNSNAQTLSTVGLKVLNPFTNDNGLSFGLGMKAVYTNQIGKRFLALPLSAYGKIEINELVYIDADLSYAPKVLSFSDADSYVDFRAKVNYKVLADGYIYLGARSITTKYDSGEEEKYDSSAFVGLEVRF